MDVGLLFRPDPLRVETVVFDAVLSERHAGMADVTAHPVEAGVEISDHVRRRPVELVIVGVVSNTPIERASAAAEAAVVARMKRLDAAAMMRRIPVAGSFLASGDEERARIEAEIRQSQVVPAEALANPSAGRAEGAWARLEGLRDRGVLVDVVTTLRTYENMAITSLVTARSGTTGAVQMEVTLREVVTVESREAEVPAELLSQARDKGRQAAKPAPQDVAQKAEEIDNRTATLRFLENLGVL